MAAPLIGGLIGGVIGGVLPGLLGKLFGRKKKRCCQQGQQFNNFPMQQPGGQFPGQFGPPNPFQAGFQQGAMLGEMQNLRQEIGQMRQMLGGGCSGQNPYQAGMQSHFGGFPGDCGQLPGGFGGFGGQPGLLGQGLFGTDLALGAALGMLSQGGAQTGGFTPAFQPFTPMLGSGFGAGMQISAFARF